MCEQSVIRSMVYNGEISNITGNGLRGRVRWDEMIGRSSNGIIVETLSGR